MVRRQRLFLAISRAEEDQPKPRIDCRRRPHVAAAAVSNSINTALSVDLAIYLKAPNQPSGFGVKGHEPSAVGYVELDPTRIHAKE